MTKLSPKQEAFCQYYTDGLPAYEAYFKAGYSAKSNSVAEAASSRLLRNVKISARLQEIKDATATPKTLTRQRIREIRAEIAEDTSANRNDRLAALRDDAKMMGMDAPQVIEVKGSLIDQLREGG